MQAVQIGNERCKDLQLQRSSLQGLIYITKRKCGKAPLEPKPHHLACFLPGVAVLNSLFRVAAASAGVAAGYVVVLPACVMVHCKREIWQVCG